jgi:hypothetical protein
VELLLFLLSLWVGGKVVPLVLAEVAVVLAIKIIMLLRPVVLIQLLLVLVELVDALLGQLLLRAVMAEILIL